MQAFVESVKQLYLNKEMKKGSDLFRKTKNGKKSTKRRRKHKKLASAPNFEAKEKEIQSDTFDSFDSETFDTTRFQTMPIPLLPSPVKPMPHMSDEIIEIPSMPPLPDEENIEQKKFMTPQERFRHLLTQ